MQYITAMPNGKKVYYKLGSHAETHLADTPHLLELVRSFFEHQDFHEPVVYLEHDAGTTVGFTDLVDVTEEDSVVYANRLNRDGYTVFAKNRQPVLTNYFTFAIQIDRAGDYELVSAWIGRKAPQFPDEPGATPESNIFWSKHALVWGTQAIQEGTETTICPWQQKIQV